MNVTGVVSNNTVFATHVTPRPSHLIVYGHGRIAMIRQLITIMFICYVMLDAGLMESLRELLQELKDRENDEKRNYNVSVSTCHNIGVPLPSRAMHPGEVTHILCTQKINK